MATLRTVMNRVLNAIGETTIAPATVSITDTYQLQVLEFVNQFKEEIEGATQWRSLWTDISSIAVTNGNVSAVIAGTNERSDLVRVQDQDGGQFIPLLYNVSTANQPLQCIEHDLREMRMAQLSDTVSNIANAITDISLGLASGQLVLQVSPKSNGTNTFKGVFYVPQIALTANDLDTVIQIPERVLVQGVVWQALEERGEELGQSSMWTEERFRKALDDAVSTDESARGGLFLVAT